jgi:hypothetical protein
VGIGDLRFIKGGSGDRPPHSDTLLQNWWKMSNGNCSPWICLSESLSPSPFSSWSVSQFCFWEYGVSILSWGSIRVTSEVSRLQGEDIFALLDCNFWFPRLLPSFLSFSQTTLLYQKLHFHHDFLLETFPRGIVF